jgi:hypothetical protein
LVVSLTEGSALTEQLACLESRFFLDWCAQIMRLKNAALGLFFTTLSQRLSRMD